MKRFTRLVCIVLVAVLLLAVPAQAAEVNSSRASYYFGSSCVYLYQISETRFQVWYEVAAVGTMDVLGASVVKVQRSADGNTWTTLSTFTKDEYTDMVRRDTCLFAGCISYTGTVGYYYRAIITLYAKKGTGVGEVTEYTSVLKL